MAAAAVLAAVFFFVVMLTLPAISGGGYDWRTSAISSGVHSRLGVLQTAAFFTLGVGMLVLGVTLADEFDGALSSVAPS